MIDNAFFICKAQNNMLPPIFRNLSQLCHNIHHCSTASSMKGHPHIYIYIYIYIFKYIHIYRQDKGAIPLVLSFGSRNFFFTFLEDSEKKRKNLALINLIKINF